MPILDLTLVKSHLRVTWASEDQLIGVYQAAAEGAAASFLNRKVFKDEDELLAAVAADTAGDDPIIANAEIQAAVLLTVGHLYANRENSVVGLSAVELPHGAREFLQPYRVGLGV
ncbi:head-tail connector protein [Cupriavidus sp. Marseille-Q8015]